MTTRTDETEAGLGCSKCGKVHFHIEGRALVGLARGRVLDEATESAIRILECLKNEGEEAGNDVIFSVLEGKKTLDGDEHGMTLVDEDPEVSADYARSLDEVFGDRARLKSHAGRWGWYRPRCAFKWTAAFRAHAAKLIARMSRIDRPSKEEEDVTIWRYALGSPDSVRVVSYEVRDAEPTASGVVGKVYVIFDRCDAPPIWIAKARFSAGAEVVRARALAVCHPRSAETGPFDSDEEWVDRKRAIRALQKGEGATVPRARFADFQAEREAEAVEEQNDRNIREEAISAAVSNRLDEENDPDNWPIWNGEGAKLPTASDEERFARNVMLAQLDPLRALASMMREINPARVAHARAQIRAQAEVSGWSLLQVGEVAVRVPRGAFEGWALQRCEDLEARVLATPWRTFSLPAWKSGGDDPLHTDWVLGATFEPGAFETEGLGEFGLGDYASIDELRDAAFTLAGDLQEWARKGGRGPRPGVDASIPGLAPLVEAVDGFRVAVLSGAGVFVGRVEHPAKGSRCSPAAIAVVPDGSPDYEAVMPFAAVVILGRGGAVCHLANLARGDEIPLVRLEDARSKLPVGTLVEVDLREGRVRILEQKA